MNLHRVWTAALASLLLTGWPPFALATTTTYEFSVPPDSVFVSTTPGGTMQADWPGQILDGGTALEENADVLFENEINNTTFIDGNALLVSNSTRMNGSFFWGDPRNNGPSDPAFFVVDFTTEAGLLPCEISFDFAVSVVTPTFEVEVFDSENDMETVAIATSGSFAHGLGTGSDGRAVLTPTGSVDNLARLRLELPEEVFEALQVGFDNFAVTLGVPGDYNDDNTVDSADYAVWRKHEGTTTLLPNDPIGNTIGTAQYEQWSAHFGQTAGSGSGLALGLSSQRAVPEPATLGLMLVGAGILARIRRRKRRRSFTVFLGSCAAPLLESGVRPLAAFCWATAGRQKTERQELLCPLSACRRGPQCRHRPAADSAPRAVRSWGSAWTIAGSSDRDTSAAMPSPTRFYWPRWAFL